MCCRQRGWKVTAGTRPTSERKEVFDLLRNERLYPRSGFNREDWSTLIDQLISAMRSNDHPEHGDT